MSTRAQSCQKVARAPKPMIIRHAAYKQKSQVKPGFFFGSPCWTRTNDTAVNTAQKYLGHSDPSTTLRIYTHLAESTELNDRMKVMSAFDGK